MGEEPNDREGWVTGAAGETGSRQYKGDRAKNTVGDGVQEL